MNISNYENLFFNDNKNNLIFIQKTKDGYKRHFHLGSFEFIEKNNETTALIPIFADTFIHVNFTEFINLKIQVVRCDINGNEIYFGFDDNMTLEDFNNIINQIQTKTELTNEEVLQFISDLLLCQPNEVYNNIGNIFMISVNYKTKDFQVYITPENIENIQEG